MATTGRPSKLGGTLGPEKSPVVVTTVGAGVVTTVVEGATDVEATVVDGPRAVVDEMAVDDVAPPPPLQAASRNATATSRAMRTQVMFEIWRGDRAANSPHSRRL
jgi:hypothetical protein